MCSANFSIVDASSLNNPMTAPAASLTPPRAALVKPKGLRFSDIQVAPGIFLNRSRTPMPASITSPRPPKAGTKLVPIDSDRSSTLPLRLSMTSRSSLAFFSSSGVITFASETPSNDLLRSSAPISIKVDIDCQPLPRSCAATLAFSAGSLIPLMRSMVFRNVALTSSDPSLRYTRSTPSSRTLSGSAPIVLFRRPIAPSTASMGTPMSPAASI